MRADAGQQRAFGVPHRGDGFLDPVAAHIVFDMLGGATQGNLAQSDQIALAKEILRRALGLLRQIDLARLEPRRQLVGRDIDQNDLIGCVQHGVGHGLVDADAGDGAHRAVQAFQVLHVEGRPNVNASIEQLLHILPTLGVARALHIAVRQLIDQRDLRLARQRGVQIKLPEHSAPVGDLAQRQLRQPGQQFGGFAATVGFDHPDHDVAPVLALALGGAEHGVGLADARTGAEINAQSAPACAGLMRPELVKKLVGIGPGVGVIGHGQHP